MPTIASKPTLESTRVVGAVLWEQFARDRFRMAGLSDNLVTEAEREDLEPIQQSLGDCNITLNSTRPNGTCSTSLRDDSTNEAADISHSSTSRNDELHYQSVAESLQEGERTVYHSMANESQDRLPVSSSQAVPIMASYGKELRRIAEEFERTRERQMLRERANQVSKSSQTLYSCPGFTVDCSPNDMPGVCILCSGTSHRYQ